MKHLKFNSDFSLAMESIAFQDGSYFKETTELVNNLRSGKTNYAAFATAFQKLTEKHTCIWVTLSYEDGYENAHIYPQWIASSNALATAGCRKYEQFTKLGFKSGEKPLTAFINNKTSKVGGFLKEIEHKMVICKSFFNSPMSDGGIAGILIHEVGHAYTFLQFSIRAMVYNVALTQASQNLSKCSTYEEVKIVFKETCDSLGIENQDFIEETKNTQNRVNQFTYLAGAIQKHFDFIPNIDVSDKFTQDACEELADIFVARHGGEKAIMEIRAQFQKDGGNGGWINKLLMNKFSSLMGGIITAGLGAAITRGGVTYGFGVLNIISGGITLLYLLVAVKSAVEIYSLLKDLKTTNGFTTAYQQIKKMQNQAIERLKSSGKLDKGLVDACIDSISYGDQLLATVRKNDSLTMSILSLFNSDMRDARAMREYQDKIEGLVANRLFLNAAQLGIN